MNKVDGLDTDIALADFYSLGVKDLYPITATQGKGVASLLSKILSTFNNQFMSMDISILNCFSLNHGPRRSLGLLDLEGLPDLVVHLALR